MSTYEPIPTTQHIEALQLTESMQREVATLGAEVIGKRQKIRVRSPTRKQMKQSLARNVEKAGVKSVMALAGR